MKLTKHVTPPPTSNLTAMRVCVTLRYVCSAVGHGCVSLFDAHTV